MNLLLNIRAKYCFLRANGIYYNCQQKGVDRMAGNTTNISIRRDADLKAQADALFTELGMNLTTAFNIFVRQSLREGGIPFEVRLEHANNGSGRIQRPYLLNGRYEPHRHQRERMLKPIL